MKAYKMKARRREGKTDYKARLNLLKSGKPRIVIRRTNKQIIIQYVLSEEAKDKIVFGVTSKDLLKHGWKKENIGKLKSIEAAYLTGYLFARKVKDRELKTGILDFGLGRTIKNSRIYFAARGIIAGGLKINFSGEVDEKIMKKEKNGLEKKK